MMFKWIKRITMLICFFAMFFSPANISLADESEGDKLDLSQAIAPGEVNATQKGQVKSVELPDNPPNFFFP